MSELPHDGRVETRAYVNGLNCDLELRLAEEDGSAIFVRPTKIDNDGEFHLSVEDFMAAMARMGADLSPWVRAPWAPPSEVHGG